MLYQLHHLLQRGLDILLTPLDRLSPWLGLGGLALLSTFLVLPVYRFLTRPERLKACKNQIKANILAIRIYRDFWRVIVASFGRSLGWTSLYFAQHLLPLLLLVPLLWPLLLQMDARYGRRTFHEGEAFVLHAVMQDDLADSELRLLDSEAVKPLMNPVRVKALGEMNWQLAPTNEGRHTIRLEINGREIEKEVVAGRHVGMLSWRRAVPDLESALLAPLEKSLPSSAGLKEISFAYPPARMKLGPFSGHWLIPYLLLVLVLALCFRKRFGVEF